MAEDFIRNGRRVLILETQLLEALGRAMGAPCDDKLANPELRYLPRRSWSLRLVQPVACPCELQTNMAKPTRNVVRNFAEPSKLPFSRFKDSTGFFHTISSHMSIPMLPVRSNLVEGKWFLLTMIIV